MEERIPFSDINLSVELLSDTEDLSDFSCGQKEIDDFFRDEVHLCVKYKYLSAYCVKYRGRVVALFTLAHDSLIFRNYEERDDLMEEPSCFVNEEYKDTFMRQSAFPSINIGHLATKTDAQSLGIGTFVINFIMGTFLEYKMAGCQFITVDSLNNPRTNLFYERNGFVYQTLSDMASSTRRMYLPLRLYDNVD